jgi:hypothetical protein
MTRCFTRSSSHSVFHRTTLPTIALGSTSTFRGWAARGHCMTSSRRPPPSANKTTRYQRISTFPARPIDQPEDDRNRLNKQLFHLSYSRLTYNETSKPWPDTILSCLHPRCIESIEHLLARGEPLVGREEAVTWRTLLEQLNSGRQLLISRPFVVSESGVAEDIFSGQVAAWNRVAANSPGRVWYLRECA